MNIDVMQIDQTITPVLSYISEYTKDEITYVPFVRVYGMVSQDFIDWLSETEDFDESVGVSYWFEIYEDRIEALYTFSKDFDDATYFKIEDQEEIYDWINEQLEEMYPCKLIDELLSEARASMEAELEKETF